MARKEPERSPNSLPDLDFADKLGGECYTPRCVIRALVEMLAKCKGRDFLSCCRSSAFVQALMMNAVRV